MKPYGAVREKTYPVASLVWGHRLRSGQEWIEYLLEFLNVASGFEYQLGRGLKEGNQKDRENQYTRLTRLGLRRFVFYHEHEKTTHKFDDLARERLFSALRERFVPSDPEAIERVRELFLGLSALEKDRSWYAKSLLPIHENLLMWEALRKGATRRDAVTVDPSVDDAELDTGIDFAQRNYFARGGELYYLILSAGTEQDSARRERIEKRLEALLRNNHPIGQLAHQIEKAWRQQEETDSSGTLHYIPDGGCDFYKIVAEDIETLLGVELDIVEHLHLLAHLICFHIVIYMYVRAHPEASSEVLNQEGCMDKVRPKLLIDALEGADNGVLRKVSATLFKVQEDLIQQRVRQFIFETIKQWANQESPNATVDELLDSHIFQASQTSFSLGSSAKAAQERFKDLSGAYRRKEISKEDLIERAAALVLEETIGDFRRHFLPVHKKLAKDIGFVTPKTGTNARYTLSDDLMKALTLANVKPSEGAITYEDFLNRLYCRYGLIFGERHARVSGLYDLQPINVEYYTRNQNALLNKMTRSGLAHEYSDATAMVAPFRS